ncbi:hypothetical protein PHET_08838 [Paragonimus heterotremus]|uniref:RIMS-binding protein 1/2/3 Fn3 domain-containing protein n=1 Tax=Paragonimus heterotremus TaxID=100268 RepID=A0A8J4TBJ7_9TREM|nr:hypothetical protein PHET_08838 [Paragonimus heterotremus]
MEPRLVRTKTCGNLTNQLTGTRETKIKQQRTKSMEFRWLPEIDIVHDEPIDFSKRYNMEDDGRGADCTVADNGIEIAKKKKSARTLKRELKHWSEVTGQTVQSYNTGTITQMSTRFKTMPPDVGLHVKENQSVGLIGNPRTMNQINVRLKMPKTNQHTGSITNLTYRDEETYFVPDMRTVGTDTEELDLQAQLRTNRMEHLIEAVQYRLEIAEAQALIFHLSERMHLSTENKTGPDSNCRTTGSNLSRPNSPTTEKQAETDQPTNEQYLEYPALRRASKPEAPSDLNAMLISADDRWFVTWTPPNLNEMTENKGIRIDGYRITVNGQEIRRVRTPLVTKAILQLQSTRVTNGPIQIGVQTVGINETLSAMTNTQLCM